MGFNWTQSSEALKTHATLEEAVEALFGGDSNPGPECKCLKMFLKVGKMTFHFRDVLVFELSVCWLSSDAAVSRDNTEQPVVEEDDDDDDDEGEWTVLQTSRPRTQQIRESNALGQSRSKSQSPTPHSRNSVKPWVELCSNRFLADWNDNRPKAVLDLGALTLM